MSVSCALLTGGEDTLRGHTVGSVDDDHVDVHATRGGNVRRDRQLAQGERALALEPLRVFPAASSLNSRVHNVMASCIDQAFEVSHTFVRKIPRTNEKKKRAILHRTAPTKHAR